MSDFRQELESQIREAAQTISRTWPLYSFVTSNPLSGLEDKSFSEAIPEARALFGGRGYPAAWQFKQALDEDRIDRSILKKKLEEHELNSSVDLHLKRLKAEDDKIQKRELGEAERSLNQILEKWLSSFLDEGRSRWAMPGREKGFYRAWKNIARVDHQIPDADKLGNLPDNKHEAIENVLGNVPPKDREHVFKYHLSALPGWVGYIKQRSQRGNDEWSEKYPIDLTDYLAVRLVLADHLGAQVVPDPEQLEPKRKKQDEVRHCFLEAWEETYRNDLKGRLNLNSTESAPADDDRPDAQLVFCIDTRSEIIRRHIESTGNYETHGYAGFFGVPVRYREHGESHSVDACPPVVEAEHEISDVPKADRQDDTKRLESWKKLKKATKNGLKNIKDNVASAFSYVEFSGVFYGFNMLRKTLFPAFSVTDTLDKGAPDYYDVTEPALNPDETEVDGEISTSGMNLEDKVTYARSAFELMGWTTFAPIVAFVGHSSDTANNPFDSSLRCGACSGNSGLPSARILASICNDEEVRAELAKDGIEIPDDTIFLAGHHNTTTDRIRILDTDLPDEYSDQVESLKEDLGKAREKAVSERLEVLPDYGSSDAVTAIEQRAGDWAQTRPEWGLAGNASFIVGPNRLRESVDLEGRAFLHSYDWEQDPDGSALAEIVGGPVVVCQWINHQYYFSSVDNRIYGSGSKITHNPVGNFGVLQGNGGALMGGLPLESLMKTDLEFQHEPLRILTIIHAPYDRVAEVIENNETVDQLIRNDWIALDVIDPTQNNECIRFGDERNKSTERERKETTSTSA